MRKCSMLGSFAFVMWVCMAFCNVVYAKPQNVAELMMALPIGGSVELVFNNTISNIPGKSMMGVVVKYPPGGMTPSHRHAKSAFITAYVLTGSIRSQVNGGPIKVYHAGESWIEEPGAHHQISENPSTSEPASLLATLVLDSHEFELTTLDAA